MESQAIVRRGFSCDVRTPGAVRRFVDEALVRWDLGELAEEAALLVSELATNAVNHAGTGIEVVIRCHEACAGADDGEQTVQVAVRDRRPDLPVVVPRSPGEPAAPDEGPKDRPDDEPQPRERGLLLVGALARSWGVTFEKDAKCVWFRLLCPRPYAPAAPDLGSGAAARRLLGAAGRPQPAELERQRRGWLAFLAEASELLTGLTDEDQVAALAAQLLVPRIATWAAVYVNEHDGARLAHCWHEDEARFTRCAGSCAG
ncbi:MAG TPA: ATP-binding protein [Actinocrinis sp.]|jgi:anti-sigma regulatory factor (Ser/Thr protein kinase)